MPQPLRLEVIELKPIRTRADHKAALKLVSRLVDLDRARGTPDGDKLDVLSTLVAAYEARRLPIDAAHPIGAIKFRLDQTGKAWGNATWNS